MKTPIALGSFEVAAAVTVNLPKKRCWVTGPGLSAIVNISIATIIYIDFLYV